jgi:predicted nuclease of predicted toxin-antitoxin system
MKGFFFDENLPNRLRFSPGLPVLSISQIGRNPTDSQIWEFARQQDLVIVSKDADFSNRIITSEPPPRVVHLRFGNLRRNEFHALLARIWPRIETLLA